MTIETKRASTDEIPVELTIERVFDAPRALVFANWIEADSLGAWFAPKGFDVVECAVDPRPGGLWSVVYRSASGELYSERGTLLDVVDPDRLRFTLLMEDGHGRVTLRTEVLVTFREHNQVTTMAFSQSGFASSAQLDSVKAGWTSCFDKLDQQLAGEAEVRALFQQWFRASERRDLDASMAPIAKDVLSYEHEAPLLHRGVEALRASCKVGFEQAPEHFRWEVPDLRVVIRGDIAVTWGLNHMHGPGIDMWSRGTRVFQRANGRWQMVHQHVSFPFDPATGAAKMDLRP